MNKLTELWIEALESGEYKQTQKTLQDAKGFCCLGVLCDVAVKHGATKQYWFDSHRITSMRRFGDLDENSSSGLTGEMRSKVDLDDFDYNEVIRMNDTLSKNFYEIADYIRNRTA